MRVDRKHTAYHEAGHAVIALVLGYDVSKVTIRAAYSYLGIARISNERCGSPGSTEVQARVDSEVDLVGHICIGLAGPLAEKLVNHSAELIAYGARVDWERAQRRDHGFTLRQVPGVAGHDRHHGPAMPVRWNERRGRRE